MCHLVCIFGGISLPWSLISSNFRVITFINTFNGYIFDFSVCRYDVNGDGHDASHYRCEYSVHMILLGNSAQALS